MVNDTVQIKYSLWFKRDEVLLININGTIFVVYETRTVRDLSVTTVGAFGAYRLFIGKHIVLSPVYLETVIHNVFSGDKIYIFRLDDYTDLQADITVSGLELEYPKLLRFLELIADKRLNVIQARNLLYTMLAF